MSRISLLQRPAHGALLFRLVWPTAILFVMTLALVFGTILWTVDSANRGAAQHQLSRLDQAIEGQLVNLFEGLKREACRGPSGPRPTTRSRG
jgi:hypothetical protein